AGGGRLDADLPLDAEHGFLELDLDQDLQVAAPHRTPPLTAAAAPEAAATEEGLEDVAQPGPGEAERIRVATRAGTGAPNGIGSEHVVALATLRVAQHLIGQGDHLEALFGARVVGVGVGVQLTRQ